MSEPPVMLTGESVTGEGAEAAQVNVVAERRAGQAGAAWATALGLRVPVTVCSSRSSNRGSL